MLKSNLLHRAAAAVAAFSLAVAVVAAQPTPPAPPAAPRSPMRVIAIGSTSYLGVGVKEIDSARAKELKLGDEAGVEITNIDDESPASRAGLKVGDVVQEYNGQRVEGLEQFIRLVRETPAGRTAHLKVSRGGNSQAMAAVIGQRKEPMAMNLDSLHQTLESMRQDMPRAFSVRVPDVPRATMAWRSGLLGIEAEALEPQLAEYFGVEKGVLVRAVTKDSPAMKAGLKAGDVIVKVEGARVSTPREITSAIRSAKDKRPINLRVFRQKAEIGVPVDVDIESAGREMAAPKVRSVGKRDFE